MAMLRAIAELNGVVLHTNTQRPVVEQLVAVLSDSQHLELLLADCSPQAREALACVLGAAGRYPVRAMERHFGAIRFFGPGRLERDRPHRSPASPAEELWYRGLLYLAFAQTPAGPTEFLYVPTDLAPLLPQPETGRSQADLPVVPSPPAILQADDRFLQDACTLLCLVQTGIVRVKATVNGFAWSSKSLYELNRFLLRPASDPEHLLELHSGEALALLLCLAEQMQWLRVDRGRVVLSGDAARTWLAADRGAQRRFLLDAWRVAADWNDLCQVPSLRCEETGSWSNDPIGSRQRFLSLAISQEPQAWYSLDALVDYVKKFQPDFQRPDGNYETWYIRQAETRKFLRGFEHWEAVEGALLRFMVTGPLHWLGAVDLGTHESPLSIPEGSRQEPSNQFRWTAAGHAWLSGAPPPQEREEAEPIIYSDFTVIVPCDAPLLDRFRVARFTTWDQVPSRVDSHAAQEASIQAGKASVTGFRYRITQTGLRRALAQGITPARIVDYLQTRLADAVPRNVIAALERWKP